MIWFEAFFEASGNLACVCVFLSFALVDADAILSSLSPFTTMSALDFVVVSNYSDDLKVLDLFVKYGPVTREVDCERCSSKCKISWGKRSAEGNTKPVYRCHKRGCTWRKSVFKGSIFEGTKLSLPQIWHLIAGYVRNRNNSFGEVMNISEHTASGFRQKINRKVQELLAEPEHAIIGGKGKVVQADETMVISGQRSSHLKALPDCPSNLPDNFPGAIWVVGAVVQGEGNQPIWAEVVPNRKAETMIEVFRRHVKPETFLLTDGHLSYPLVAKALNCEHHAVIHNDGVICQETGTNTQKIESFWAFLKHLLDKQWGTDRAHADLFVSEVVFYKRYLKDTPVEGLKMLLKKLFE